MVAIKILVLLIFAAHYTHGLDLSSIVKHFGRSRRIFHTATNESQFMGLRLIKESYEYYGFGCSDPEFRMPHTGFFPCNIVNITVRRVTALGPAQVTVKDGGLQNTFVKLRISGRLCGWVMLHIHLYGLDSDENCPHHLPKWYTNPRFILLLELIRDFAGGMILNFFFGHYRFVHFVLKALLAVYKRKLI